MLNNFHNSEFGIENNVIFAVQELNQDVFNTLRKIDTIDEKGKIRLEFI